MVQKETCYLLVLRLLLKAGGSCVCFVKALFYFFILSVAYLCGPLEDGQTYDSIILSSDSSDSATACAWDGSLMILFWAFIYLALAVIFTSLDRFISASLAVSSISLLDHENVY